MLLFFSFKVGWPCNLLPKRAGTVPEIKISPRLTRRGGRTYGPFCQNQFIDDHIFLPMVLAREHHALLLLSRGRIPYSSAKIISFKIRLPAYLWGSIKVLAIQKRHQSKRIELCALGLCQSKVADFPDEEKGIKLYWEGCHRMKVKMEVRSASTLFDVVEKHL